MKFNSLRKLTFCKKSIFKDQSLKYFDFSLNFVFFAKHFNKPFKDFQISK